MVAVPAGHQHLFGHPQHPSMRRRRSSNPSLAPNSCARRYPTSPLPETSSMSSSLCRISTNDPRSQPLPVAGAPAGAPLCCPAFSGCFVPRVSGVFRRFPAFPAVSGGFRLFRTRRFCRGARPFRLVDSHHLRRAHGRLLRRSPPETRPKNLPEIHACAHPCPLQVAHASPY